jgi:hypothetical protein
MSRFRVPQIVEVNRVVTSGSAFIKAYRENLIHRTNIPPSNGCNPLHLAAHPNLPEVEKIVRLRAIRQARHFPFDLPVFAIVAIVFDPCG